ncbi:hypothetical protein [Natrarchaeobaculum sulfurireducens]|nr:hypothetical protein [Natrarchaeobaculum sulfurireducens]
MRGRPRGSLRETATGRVSDEGIRELERYTDVQDFARVVADE